MLDLTKQFKGLTTYAHTKQGEILDWCPTFLPEMDHVMLGGIPLSGKISEIYGKRSCGKSTFLMSAIKHLTDSNVTVVYLDVEGTASAARMASLGIDVSKVVLPKHKVTKKGVVPLSIEKIQSIIQQISAVAIQQKQQVVFVWDTIAWTKSNMQLQSSADQQTMGTQARAINKLLSTLNGDFISGYVTLICLNQARDNLNANNPYQAKTPITSGGEGLDHAVSLELYMKQGTKIKAHSTDKVGIGHQAVLKFVKSKIGGNAGLQGTVDVLNAPGAGCDFAYNIYDEAREIGLITGSAWQHMKFNGQNLSKRSAQWVKFLRSLKGKPVLYYIWRKLIKYYFPQCYPCLFNEYIEFNSANYPFLKNMRKYYIKIQHKLPKNQQNFNYKNWASIHPKSVKKALK